MPKIAKLLTATQVARLTTSDAKHTHYYVGGVPGLALQVMPNGTRSWTLRFTLGNRRRDMGLGPYPAVSLGTARDKAKQARELIDAGLNPIVERRKERSALLAQQAKAVTFEDAAGTLIDAKSPEWRSLKHGAQWTATLKTYAYPVIGQMLVSDVEVSHILKILRPIWTTRTETASRVRNRVEGVLDWATANGLRSGPNPARWKGHNVLLREAASALRRLDEDMAIQFSRQRTRAAADRAAALATALPTLKNQSSCECGMQGLHGTVIEALTCAYDALIFAHRVNPHLGAEGRKQYFETLSRITAIKSALQDAAASNAPHNAP